MFVAIDSYRLKTAAMLRRVLVLAMFEHWNPVVPDAAIPESVRFDLVRQRIIRLKTAHRPIVWLSNEPAPRGPTRPANWS